MNRATEMDQPPSNFTWLQWLLYILFACIGGALGHVLRTLDAGGHVSMWRTLLESLAAGFVGIIVMLICQQLNLSAQWTGVCVGVCGWLGATVSIRMLERLVRSRLGVQAGSDDVR
jgi:hypothetical protein